MNHKKTLIALAVIMLAAIPISVIMSEGSDAKMIADDDGIWGGGFNDRNDGTLFVTLKSDEVNDQAVTITVTDKNGRVLASSTVTVPAEDTLIAELRFRLSAGEHDLTVTIKAENPVFILPGGSSTDTVTRSVTVNVTQSVLSKPSTYAAIAIVAILIVIAAFLYMRNAPTVKHDTTFTELERQKKEARGETEEAPKTSATERKRYKDSSGGSKEARQKEQAKSPAPPPEEKKAATFTELDKQKREKKEAPPPKQKETPPPKKKESSSEEPKKLKYVSSRRK